MPRVHYGDEEQLSMETEDRFPCVCGPRPQPVFMSTLACLERVTVSPRKRCYHGEIAASRRSCGNVAASNP